MKTLLTFCLLFCLSVLSYGQTASPIYDSMQGVSGAEKITNLAEVEADLGRFTNLSATTGILSTANAQTLNVTGNATVNGNTTVANTIYSTTVVPAYINDSITDESILSGRIYRTIGSDVYSELADLQTVGLEDYFYNGINNGIASDIGSASTWTDLGQQYSQTYILSLAYVGNGICLAGTNPSGKILRSSDYGQTWTDLGQQYSQTHIYSLAYVGNGICLAGTGSGGKILRSSDYGQTWADLGQQYSQTHIYSLAYVGNGICLAGTYPNGKILRSKIFNDSLAWVKKNNSNSIYYLNGNVGIGTNNPTETLYVNGGIYAATDISAATFTDRTPAPPEDSLSQILKVSFKDGKIDHSSLGAAEVKRTQKISYVNVYSGTDSSTPIAKIPTTLNENIINITEEVPEQIISATEAIELVTKDVIKKVTRTIILPSGGEIVETTTQEVIKLKPNVVQENDVYKIPSYTRIVGQRNLIKEKIEQEYNIPQEEIILQEQEVIEEVGSRDLGMSISMSIRSIQQLYSIIEEIQTRLENLEGGKPLLQASP